MLLNAGFYTELSHLNLLKIIKAIDNYACTLCGNSTETVQHILLVVTIHCLCGISLLFTYKILLQIELVSIYQMLSKEIVLF